MFKYDDSMAEDDGDIESGKKSGVSGELGRDGKPRAADDEDDPDSPMKMVRRLKLICSYMQRYSALIFLVVDFSSVFVVCCGSESH